MNPTLRLCVLCAALALAWPAHAEAPSPLKDVLESQKRAAAPAPAVRQPQAAETPLREEAGRPPAAPSQSGAKAAEAKDIDPIRGRPASLERKLLELEEAQIEAKIAAERLARRKAEIEVKKLEAEARGASAGPAPAQIEEALKKLERAAQKSVQAKAPESAPPAPPAPALPRLAGIVETGDGRIALVEHGGRLSAARAGESVGGLKVDRVEAGAAVVNGVRLAAEDRPGRINWSSDAPARARDPVSQGAPPAALPAPRSAAPAGVGAGMPLVISPPTMR